MSWKPYDGSEYLDFAAVENFCRNLAAQHPEWVTLEEIGRSHHDRPLLLLTLSRTDGDVSRRPGFWLDGGTHAAEFTGVMAAIYAVSRWVSQLAEGEKSVVDWFSHRAVYVMPCISPDGFQAMCDGAPFIRSSLRPPQPGTVRSGLDPCDIDGDGVVRWMRWKHPAGSFVPDPDVPLFMRPRTLEDDPEDAYFLCDEGEFIQWDGGRWRSAPKAFGVDLNRNFPGSWQPFEMFGMDGGAFSLSEPESRAVVDAFSGRPFIGAGLTNHTYTGCLLTQPYAKNPPISKADIDLMEHLAKEAVKGTDYKVFKVNPEFTYDPDKLIVGVWADSMVSVFGVPGYTLELWDPLGEAGLELEKPLEFFLKPDPEQMKKLFAHFSAEGHAVEPWRSFDHPQLGEVEIGGIDYLRTLRNPPVDKLQGECEAGFKVADALRRALPDVSGSLRTEHHGKTWSVEVTLENHGYLPTSATLRGARLTGAPKISAKLECSEGLTIVSGPDEIELEHLEGWGQTLVGSGRNPVYASLPSHGHRTIARWMVEGSGKVTVTWCAGRAGEGRVDGHLAGE
ncbi:MAG: hypothetical protein AMJ59_23910 [Gammaproteobacteria bacterium SG8_31]|nr:MAG: hypothetical protein AMJ59_23910 [Gammaproteobacteria bacterium SG8_31]